MTIDKARLQRIADKKVSNEAPIPLRQRCDVCVGFRWDFRSKKETKTCLECGHIDLVVGNNEKVVV